MATYAQEWMIQVCKELGFDPQYVSRIVIELSATEKVYLKIEADPKQSETIIKLLVETGRWAHRATVLEDGKSPHELVKASPAWLRESMAQLHGADLAEFAEVLAQLAAEANGHLDLEREQTHAL